MCHENKKRVCFQSFHIKVGGTFTPSTCFSLSLSHSLTPRYPSWLPPVPSARLIDQKKALKCSSVFAWLNSRTAGEASLGFFLLSFFFFSPPAFARTPILCATFTLSCCLFFSFSPPLRRALFYALLQFNTYTLGNIQDSISHGGGKKNNIYLARGEKKKTNSRSESLQADNNNTEDKKNGAERTAGKV